MQRYIKSVNHVFYCCLLLLCVAIIFSTRYCLVQFSSHTPHLLHRQSRLGFVDVLFRQKAVGFPHSRTAIRRLILLFGRFAVFLHDTLNVGGFGRCKDRLVLFRSEMDNRHDSPFEYLARMIHSRQ